MNEKRIKCKLIDYLLIKYPDSIIGVEIPFLSGKRWVDVLLINKKNELIAFEVKSEFDTLRRLEDQIADYLNTFDRIYLVISIKFKGHKLLKHLSKNIGLAFVDENEKIFFVRPAIKNKRLLKSNLSYFLWRNDLTHFSMRKQDSVVKLRTRLRKICSVRNVHKMAVDALLARYQDRFDVFKREKSKYTHQEDLEYLTRTYKTFL